MPKYIVYVTETVDYSVEVENEDAAVAAAEAAHIDGGSDFIGVSDRNFEAQAPSTCSDCGKRVPEILGCPDGAEVCKDCEHKH